VDIKVLGSGCANCKALEARTRAVLDDLGVVAPIEKVTDFADIAGYGVMTTPALVIDGEVVVAGRVPPVADLVAIIERATA
jgi:small redox-active disulfide protein 2